MNSTDVSPRLACVIVTFNGAPWLLQCLHSLIASTIPSYIIVVDNDSTDSTVSIAKSIPQVDLIETGANLGFGRANNIGISRALELGCDHVFILNQDAHVAPTALEILINEATAQQDYGILCPLQLNDDGTELDPTFLQHYLARFAPKLLNDAVLGRALESHYAAPAAPAAAWLFSRRFLTEVGGFDPLFFMYGEDDDLCSRAEYHGFKLGIIPSSHFYHCRGFHGAVSSESRRKRLKRRTSRLRSGMVREIKELQGSMGKHAWHSLTKNLGAGFSALLGHLDWIEAVAALAAALRVTFELPKIARHRELCRTKAAHWLSSQPTDFHRST